MKKLFLAILLFPLAAIAQHSVTLTWTASSDAGSNPSLTYNVYRAPAACSTNPTFTLVNSTQPGILTFTDTPINPGTYCYQVTSVLNGAESLPSNQANTVVLPAPPSNLTGKSN